VYLVVAMITNLPKHTAILLAEDNDNDAFFIQRAFEEARVANPLHRVRDGQETIEYLGGHGIYKDRDQFPYPCFLLLDLRMPRVSGFEVLQWIRSHPEHKDLPVVVLTAEKEDPLVQKARDLGATSLFRKTPLFEDMVKLVEGLHSYWLITNVPPQLLVEA
jgi:CheY-like chemotaxis protein